MQLGPCRFPLSFLSFVLMFFFHFGLFLFSPGRQIFYKHGVRLVEAAEIQLESQGGVATTAVFILPYL